MSVRTLKLSPVVALIVGIATLGASAQSVVELGNEILLPPNAKPGECYARIFVPPTYRTESERVLVKEDSERVEIVPARYEWVEETVLVTGATSKLEVVPATYEWVEERVLVKDATSRLEGIPAVYETETERLLDQPAHTVWKKGEGLIQQVDNATGEIMCLVEVPTTYKTVTKTVLKSDATTRTVKIPAEYETVKQRVQKTPPTTRTVEIPAEYKTVRVKKQAAAPAVERFPIPAVYNTVSRTVKETDGHLEWRAVLCQTNATRAVISDIQRSLLDAGHTPGPIDGIIGTETLAAVQSFQVSKGLVRGGITVETLDALGINL